MVHGATGGSPEAPEARKAVDIIQATPWRIGPDVLRFVREVVAERYTERWWGLPAFPGDMSDSRSGADELERDESEWMWDFQSPEERRAAKIEADERCRVLQTLAIAEELVGEDVFIPHYLDWRGRIYAVPGAGLLQGESEGREPKVGRADDDRAYGGVLNPQAGDLGRALLRFGEGKPLGTEGARYLAFHGANCHGRELAGRSKVDRVAWVREHTPQIEATAHVPRDSVLMDRAEDPLQFYAFAREWASYMEHKREGKPGETFVSHLPCGQDGSCNGVQHFAALWHDRGTAERVNLLPSTWDDPPKDFYADVAVASRRRLLELADEGDERAQRWAPLAGKLFTRATLKVPAMTFVYGATESGLQVRIAARGRKILNDPEHVFAA